MSASARCYRGRPPLPGQISAAESVVSLSGFALLAGPKKTRQVLRRGAGRGEDRYDGACRMESSSVRNTAYGAGPHAGGRLFSLSLAWQIVWCALVPMVPRNPPYSSQAPSCKLYHGALKGDPLISHHLARQTTAAAAGQQPWHGEAPRRRQPVAQAMPENASGPSVPQGAGGVMVVGALERWSVGVPAVLDPGGRHTMVAAL